MYVYEQYLKRRDRCKDEGVGDKCQQLFFYQTSHLYIVRLIVQNKSQVPRD